MCGPARGYGAPMLRRFGTLIAIALGGALAVAPAFAAAAAPPSPTALRIAIPGDDGSLTPYTFESGYAFMSLVYDTLTWRDAAGVAQPWLARSIRRDAAEGTVRVQLRRGIRWHDGQPLTADDVVFTYRYMAAHPHPRFTPELQDIARVEANGPLRVTFVMRRLSLGVEDQPFADVPILPRHLWQDLPAGRRAPPGLPVGTGPYRLTSHIPGRSYRFEANRGYFRGAPSVTRIDVPVIRRQSAIVTELRRRRVDAIPVTVAPGAPTPRLPAIRFSDEVSFTGTMLLFNVAGRPFNRLVARRAVSRALDLDLIAGNATGARGRPVPADHGLLHPKSRWARAGVLHRYAPRAARLAFAEQGIGAFTVVAPRNDPVRLAAGERVVDALRSAGAGARLRKLSPRALDRALGRRGVRATFDVAVVGIPALASYDPSFLRAVFGDPRTAPLNDGRYRSTTFDDLAERSAAAHNLRDRREIVNDQLRLLARDLPAVPLLFGGGTFAYRPRAYDRWVSIRGSGILDKRSFLRGPSADPAAAQSGAPADLTDPSGDEGFSLVPIIIGFGLLMLIAGGLALRRSRR
jgi:peptide/nickel transport system substrate-binding protein